MRAWFVNHIVLLTYNWSQLLQSFLQPFLLLQSFLQPFLLLQSLLHSIVLHSLLHSFFVLHSLLHLPPFFLQSRLSASATRIRTKMKSTINPRLSCTSSCTSARLARTSSGGNSSSSSYSSYTGTSSRKNPRHQLGSTKHSQNGTGHRMIYVGFCSGTRPRLRCTHPYRQSSISFSLRSTLCRKCNLRWTCTLLEYFGKLV